MADPALAPAAELFKLRAMSLLRGSRLTAATALVRSATPVTPASALEASDGAGSRRLAGFITLESVDTALGPGCMPGLLATDDVPLALSRIGMLALASAISPAMTVTPSTLTGSWFAPA